MNSAHTMYRTAIPSKENKTHLVNASLNAGYHWHPSLWIAMCSEQLPNTILTQWDYTVQVVEAESELFMPQGYQMPPQS